MRWAIGACVGMFAAAAGCDGRSIESIQGRIGMAEARAREAQAPELDLEVGAEGENERVVEEHPQPPAGGTVVRVVANGQVVVGAGRVVRANAGMPSRAWVQAFVSRGLAGTELTSPELAAAAIQGVLRRLLDERWQMGGRARMGLVPHTEVVTLPSVGGRPVRFHVALGTEDTDGGSRLTVTVEPLDELTRDANAR